MAISIITICLLLLIAYVFDITSSKTKIPSVVLLLILGRFVRFFSNIAGLSLPDLNPFLPLLGTIGLILIVLEGSLELQLNTSKKKVIIQSFITALVPIVFGSFTLAGAFYYFGLGSFHASIINAIPFCIISSAIAIPSMRYFRQKKKEFVTYESSISDIIGVVLFNFFMINESINLSSFTTFGAEILLMGAISLIATLGLSLLLGRLDHHVKFTPIVLLIILIYEVEKFYHLPALIFILIFGIFIENLDIFSHIKWIKNLHPERMDKEVHKLKEIVSEGSFLVRSLFFMVFGYLIETADIINPQTLIWAIAIVGGGFIIRGICLWLFKKSFSSLFFVQPRGLITILLFLSITPAQSILIPGQPLVIQVILLSTLMMMLGLMLFGKSAQNKETYNK